MLKILAVIARLYKTSTYNNRTNDTAIVALNSFVGKRLPSGKFFSLLKINIIIKPPQKIIEKISNFLTESKIVIFFWGGGEESPQILSPLSVLNVM